MSTEIVIKSLEQLNTIIDTKKTIILYFDTNSWGVGKAVFPKLMDLAIEYDLDVHSINMDNKPLIKGQHLVFAAPTVLIMESSKELLRESKFIDFKKIKRLLEALNN